MNVKNWDEAVSLRESYGAFLRKSEQLLLATPAKRATNCPHECGEKCEGGRWRGPAISPTSSPASMMRLVRAVLRRRGSRLIGGQSKRRGSWWTRQAVSTGISLIKWGEKSVLPLLYIMVYLGHDQRELCPVWLTPVSSLIMINWSFKLKYIFYSKHPERVGPAVGM